MCQVSWSGGEGVGLSDCVKVSCIMWQGVGLRVVINVIPERIYRGSIKLSSLGESRIENR
mgnify:CR=1 FL=1